MRPIHVIATDILKDWAKPNFAAVPYLNAMLSLNSVADHYGHDRASGIVLYFLSNASSYRGPRAKELKAELKALLKAAAKR